MSKKILAVLLIVIFLPLASANTVDNVDFPEIPTAWETGQDLEFSFEASGDSLDNVRFQSRESGERLFVTQETFYCSNRDTCSRNFDHTESSEGTWEYRFRAYAGADRGNSDNYREVTYYDNLDYSVSWTERPPSSAGEGDEIEIGVRAEDDADRFDSEGVLSLQYRDSDGDWTSFDSRDCSSSSTDSSCSNTGNIDLEGDVIDDEEAEFRGFVEFKGGVTAESSVETVEIDGEEASVDDVEIDDLPSSHPIDDDLEITGEADGENLDEITLEKREEDDDWEDVADESCSGDNCDFEYDYDHDDVEEVDFRLRAEAGDDEEYSDDTETVDFYDPDDIDEVDIEDLPSEHPVDDDLEIEASAEGEDLDELEVQESDRDEDDWSQVEDYDCDGSDNCDFEADYTADEEEEKDFRVKATSESGSEDYSDVEEVDFVEDEDVEASVDDVNIDDLPSEYETGDSLDVDGDASGTELDHIEIQFRDDSGWERLERKDCDDDSSCIISDSYTASDDGEIDFRIRAEAGDDSDESDTETVDFVTTPAIDSVDIDPLPSRHPINDNLEISGEASGRLLTSIIIEKRTGGGWSEEFSESCGESSSCSISRDFSTPSEETVDFRIKVETDEDSDTSSTETVDFYEERKVDSVTIDDLPSNFETGSSLDIDGEASGSNLDSLEVLTRGRDDISWEIIDSKSCGESSFCSISTSYTSDTEEGREFVVKAIAGGDTEFSSTEYVEFSDSSTPEVGSVILDSLPSRHPVTDLDIDAEASGTELDSLKIQFRDDSGWEDLADTSCSGSSCSLSDVYTPSEEEEIDFRARAEASGDTAYSSVQTVTFEDADDPEVFSVSIDDIGGSYPVDTVLEFSGEANGNELDNITVQENRDGSWTELATENCSGSSCSITVSVSETDEGSINYRVRAQAGTDEAYTPAETVDYTEDDEMEPEVDSVDLDELPSNYDVDDRLDIDAEASGKELESLEVLYRDADDISWIELEEISCEGSDCELSTDYTSEESETIEFVAEASAGDDTERSDVEVVDFDDTEDDDEGDDAEEADLDVEVEDRYGNELENVRVEASNGETKVEYTDDDGEADFDLEAGDYDVEASKDGYDTESQSVDLDPGESEDLRFRLGDGGFPVRVIGVNAPAEVCEGDSFEVEGVFSNLRDRDITVAVGLEGDVESSYMSLEIEGGDVERISLNADSISGTGQKEISVVAENDGRDSRDFTVRSQDCDDRERDTQRDNPTGISLNSRSTVVEGETVRLSGDVQNVRSSKNVRISVDGDQKAETTTSRNGRYQSFVQLNSPGRKTVRATTEGVEARKTVSVVPRAVVNPLQMPETAVQGETIDICAEIDSSSDAKVVLQEEGDVLDSKNGRGEICFEVEASDPGEHRYKIRAINSGVGGEASDTVRVIEQRPEAESFPGVITAVETESGMSKVSIYNTHDSVKSYDLELTGIDSRQASQTSETVVLAPGDEENVYFYFSPSESTEASVEIRSEGELVDEKTFEIQTVSRERRARSSGLLDFFF